jgi:hypothetical protein
VRHRFSACTLVLLTTLMVACGADDPPPSDEADGTTDDHGDIAGAVELDEPALGLTTVDGAGVVRHLDLLDERERDLADLGAAEGVHTDGRYLFVEADRGVEVIDSGVWTWDHVDHYHYYRADPREIGLVEGQGPAAVATTNSSTSGGTGVFFGETGEAVLLDTGALADGSLSEHFRIEVDPHDGMLVPVGDHALLTAPGRGGVPDRVLGLDVDGEPVPGEEHGCDGADGTIATRVGTVIGCSDGALLATSDGTDLQVERVPYPEDASAPPATSFAARDGRPTVAALAGTDGIWLLDTRERTWRLLDSPVPLVQVTAVDDDDEHVLGLTTDGRVAVLDGEKGTLLASSEPLVARSLRSGQGVLTLVADQQRAYLNAPAERRLHEIDFVDGARVARTFTTPTEPLFVAGTGR